MRTLRQVGSRSATDLSMLDACMWNRIELTRKVYVCLTILSNIYRGSVSNFLWQHMLLEAALSSSYLNRSCYRQIISVFKYVYVSPWIKYIKIDF